MAKARYLFPKDYMADPSANVFNGRLYVYPSHDWCSMEGCTSIPPMTGTAANVSTTTADTSK